MKTKLCFLPYLIIAMLWATATDAQYSISGKVKDQSGRGLSYAIVTLVRDKDSLQSNFTDGAGAYSLQADSPGCYLIKSSMAGFEDQTSSIEIRQFRTTIDIEMVPRTHYLDDVTVSATKPLFERKADRMIFNISSSLTAAGGRALDALKKTPGVLIRQNDNSITLIGKNEVRVMINGRMMELAGEDLIAWLQSIPSDNIDRIEIITTPPAQYDASGNSGLINIVLKKHLKAGFNGDLRAGYEQASYGNPIGGGNLNYRRGKLNLYANGSFSDAANHIIERLNTDIPSALFRLSDNYKRVKRTIQYTAGVDYEAWRNSIFGVQLTGTDFRRTDAENINMPALNPDTRDIDSLLHTDAGQVATNHEDAVNLNYVWSIDTSGKKLTLNANRLWYNGDKNRHFETSRFAGPELMLQEDPSRNKNIGHQHMEITTAQADIELPLKPMKLSAGGKLSNITNESRNSLLYFADGTYQQDTAVSNRFNYKEDVQAIYLSAEKQAGKWDIQAGLRAEFTQTEGHSLKLGQTNTNSYFNLFPTVYVQYTMNEKNIFNLNYSKRVNRPGYGELDPFRAYTSPYSYIEGNPSLSPSFNHNLELNYSRDGKYNVSAFYQYEQNHFGQVFFVDSLKAGTYVTRENFADISGYGFTMSGSFNPTGWWEALVQGNAMIQQINSKYYDNGTRPFRTSVLYLVANNSFRLNKKKTLLAEANMYYLSRYQSEFWETEPIFNLDAGLRAVFMDGKLSFSLNAADLLGTQKFKGLNKATGQTLNNYFDNRNVRLTLFYKFGSKQVKGFRQRRTGIEEEKNRV